MSNKNKAPRTPGDAAEKADEKLNTDIPVQDDPAAQQTAEQPAQPAPEEKKGPTPEELLSAEKDRYLRLMAEYDNYRKRSTRERDSIYAEVKADTVTRFLPVYDNLARALEQSTEDAAYRKGVELIMAQFNEVISKLGVAPIEAVGKQFDPALHNAVMHETDETKGENEIVLELQKGFKMGDKVIRFSMVKTVN
jgi:molecular chaperone GrpE